MMLPLLLSAALQACPVLQAPDTYQADQLALMLFEEPAQIARVKSRYQPDALVLAYTTDAAMGIPNVMHLPNPCTWTRRDFAAREFCKASGSDKLMFAAGVTRAAFVKACGRAVIFACVAPLKPPSRVRTVIYDREDPAGWACILTHEAAHIDTPGHKGWPGTHPAR